MSKPEVIYNKKTKARIYQERLKMKAAIAYRLLCFVILACIFLAFSSADVQSADSPWPMFQHDAQHTGRSQFVGPQSNTAKWTWEMPNGNTPISPPIIGSDGTIYITLREGSGHEGSLYAISSDGGFRWKSTTFSISGFCCWSGMISAAIGADNTIYVGGEFIIYALNPDGSTKWTFVPTSFGFSEGPQIIVGTDEILYVTAGTLSWGSNAGYIFALNPDGSLKWLYSTNNGNHGWYPPALGQDGTIYAVSRTPYSNTGVIEAISPEGLLKWQVGFGAYGNSESTPVIGLDGTIYNSASGGFSAFDMTGQQKYVITTGGRTSPLAITSDRSMIGSVTVDEGNSSIKAFDLDGSVKWTFSLDVNDMPLQPIIDAQGTTYLGVNPTGSSLSAKLLAINSDGTLKWNHAFSSGSSIQSQLAIAADGTLYVSVFEGTSLKLYTFGSASPPTITTGSATNITSSSATLNGTVNANGLTATAWFDYGATSGGPCLHTDTQTVTGSSDTPVSIGISGLLAGTKYYYRLVAENTAGKTEGSEETFETAKPHINNLSSYFGSPGTAVTINGVNFGDTQGVINFGATTTSVTSWNDTSIVITVPELPPETYSISVTTGGQTSNAISFLLTKPSSEGDFSIDVKPALQTVARGSSALYSVFIKPINGFNEPVTLQVDGLPQGASASFQRNPVFPGEWVDLTIKTTEETPIKVHSFIVKGIASGLNHGKSAKLQVKPPKTVVDLKRSYSSDLTVLLIAKNKTQTVDKITADVSLMNTTGTWMKATLKQEDHSVAINKDEDYVILLGPYATKSLGVIKFQEGEHLHYDGDRVSFEPLTVLAIDLFLRGALGQEVPPNAFMDVFSYYDYGDTLLGDVLRKLLDEEFGCSSLAIDFGKDLKEGHAIGILNDLAELLQCTGAIKQEMQKLFMQVLKDKKLAGKAAKFLNKGVDTIIGLLQVPDHYVEFKILMCPSLVPPIDGYFESLGLCDTLGSPLEGFVRLEAVAEE